MNDSSQKKHGDGDRIYRHAAEFTNIERQLDCRYPVLPGNNELPRDHVCGNRNDGSGDRAILARHQSWRYHAGRRHADGNTNCYSNSNGDTDRNCITDANVHTGWS
jgi:hypothetical protein